jgi:hypothetical protein
MVVALGVVEGGGTGAPRVKPKLRIHRRELRQRRPGGAELGQRPVLPADAVALQTKVREPEELQPHQEE